MTEKKSNEVDSLDLFPEEIIERSPHYHYWKHSIRSQAMYLIILAFLLMTVAALPFIYVDVGVTSRGIIRPVGNSKAIVSPVAGRIAYLGMSENDLITKGELVIEMESPLLNSGLESNLIRQREIGQYIRDLEHLIELDSVSVMNQQPILESRIYARLLAGFQQALRSMRMEIRDFENVFKRNEYLYEKELISNADFEESKLLYDMAVIRHDQLREERMSEWEADLIQYRRELHDLKNEEARYIEQKSQYKIYMPVTGTIQNMSGITVGSFLQANQRIAEISPDTVLVVESVIPPGDIGLIVEGMSVRYRLDTFDYNQWGTVGGKVIDVSDDILIEGNRPFFKVVSTLDQSFLELPDGTRGHLGKGMTLQARFKVADQSLFQSLYQDVDDWLNPMWNRDS